MKALSTKSLQNLEVFLKAHDADEVFSHLKEFLEFDTVDAELEQDQTFLKKKSVRNRLILISALLFVPLTFFLSSFAVLVPLIHGLGGFLLHRKEGWTFYQPGKGGVKFIALNSVGWIFYATTMILQISHLFYGEFFLSFSAFISGMISLSFICSSLFAYRSTLSEKLSPDDKLIDSTKVPDTFQLESLVKSGENPSGLWWVFISFQLMLVSIGTWLSFLLAFLNESSWGTLGTFFLAYACYAGCTPVTHAIGGKWKNFGTGFADYQPFEGGKTFVVLQGAAWTIYALMHLFALITFVMMVMDQLNPTFLVASGVSGLISELLIISSLFKFQQIGKRSIKTEDKLMAFLIKFVIQFANWAFGPKINWQDQTRKTSLNDRNSWKESEKNLQNVLQSQNADKATGEQYLIVGCGFVGKRIVRRLLQRGETKIRIFDVSPLNPFEGFSNIEYVRGDVTKLEQIQKACESVDVVYATFALIRFMDRLPHQAALSYHVNVRGTEVLFEALKSRSKVKSKTTGPLRVIVTSSSHATTDEMSMPRRNRTEKAAYVTRKTSHNHYGWTKALAEKHALNQNDAKSNLLVTVIRPCSGVFGGDDRTSLEKCLDMGVAPGIGAFCEMDWVYVENVVLGHLLAESALRDESKVSKVAGEAFNVSNNDPTTWIDFWHLVQDTCKLQFGSDLSRKEVKVQFCFVPMSLIWATAYFSEMVQRIFKGRVSLGTDLDMMTPAMLSTSTMSYTYGSEKANKVLGYIPAYSLDHGVQKAVEEYYTIKVDQKPLFHAKCT